MQAFCEQENIPYEICGKVIVATNEIELESLYQIAERGQKNGVQCELIDKHRLLELEPHVAGIEAIHVRESGIVNFRGEYFKLKPSAEHLCRNLIYPVPDICFPFLDVHFTKMIDGGVECGLNAVLAFAREGYHLRHVNLRDLEESLAYTGFRRLIGRYWRIGLGEMWRSLSKAAFVRGLQRLVPAITSDDLLPAPAGVRAQVVTPDGRLLDDFAFHESRRIVHVINAPSPAATASLSIGRAIVERLAQRFV